VSETSLLDLTVREIAAELPNLSTETLAALREAEAAGKTRKTVIEAIDEELAARERGEEPPAPPPALADLEVVTMAEAELRILGADYTGATCEIRVGAHRFSGTGETREAAYRSAVGAWLASEGKALA
jgi:hypothetical protein